jgi:anti-anti-sigma factor
MTTPFDQEFPSPGPERGTRPDRRAAVKAETSPRARQPAAVTLPGEIDLANAGEVRDALARALETGTAVVIADAAETTFCDCAGVGALIRAHRQAAAAGTGLRVAAAASGSVRRILELTGADQVLDIYPTLTAALDGPARAPGAQSRPARAPASPAPREHATAAGSDGGMACRSATPFIRAASKEENRDNGLRATAPFMLTSAREGKIAPGSGRHSDTTTTPGGTSVSP